jgi:hypothetical protein
VLLAEALDSEKLDIVGDKPADSYFVYNYPTPHVQLEGPVKKKVSGFAVTGLRSCCTAVHSCGVVGCVVAGVVSALCLCAAQPAAHAVVLRRANSHRRIAIWC